MSKVERWLVFLPTHALQWRSSKEEAENYARQNGVAEQDIPNAIRKV